MDGEGRSAKTSDDGGPSTLGAFTSVEAGRRAPRARATRPSSPAATRRRPPRVRLGGRVTGVRGARTW